MSQTVTEDLRCRVEDLRISLPARGVDVVDQVDLTLRAGEILGLVGESGSGKTTTGTALLGYAPYRGRDLGRRHRGRRVQGARVGARPGAGHRGVTIGYVPQDPTSALNPSIRIGAQLRELLDLHDIGSADERGERVRQILPEVGLPNDDEFLRRYPHQLSGGQVQRVALAMVFLPGPRCWCWTSPPPAWTSPPRAWCCAPWTSCASGSTSPRCTSPTTCRWWPPSRTGWR
ncbi:MAG: ATP-binding cassette domain-containing protein [Micropruina sp.]